jgi:hypothetical protein
MRSSPPRPRPKPVIPEKCSTLERISDLGRGGGM